MISHSKKIVSLFAVALTLLSCIVFNACDADEALVPTPVDDEYLSIAREVLKDCIVLNATAMQGTVNKTLLKEGCPLKYYLEWKGKDTLNMQLKEFSVGKMPVTVWFSANCKFMQLNTWEKDEYPEEGWIKFQATGGVTYYTGNGNDMNGSYESGEGGAGTVVGYFNVRTHEIESVTNFNVMNMSSDVYLQKVDPSRLERYDEEFAKYEADLAKYKEEHGL